MLFTQGEQNILMKYPVDKFNVSSGTTGKCKLLPASTKAMQEVFSTVFLPYLEKLNSIQKKHSSFAPLKSVLLSLTPRWRYTEKTHVPIGPASGFHPERRIKIASFFRTSPDQICYLYLSEPSQLYLHWLFALLDGDIARIDGTFAGSLLFAIELLNSNWKLLAHDVRHGTISKTSSTEDIPVALIEELKKKKLVWKDPVRADEIEHEFSKGFEGIVSRLWPRISVIPVCCTGAHTVHVPRLRWYCGDEIVFYSAFYGASEGIVAMNMDPTNQRQAYTLQPGVLFMEFIPEISIPEKQPKTLLIDQIKVGHRYEVVITTHGFYRYRMGDLIQVVDFRHGVTPVIEFCSRVGSILDVRGEKTSEDMILKAMQIFDAKFQMVSGGVSNFTTTDSSSYFTYSGDKQGTGLFYVIFVEFENLSRKLNNDEIAIFDDTLQEITYPYKSFRVRNSILPPKVSFKF